MPELWGEDGRVTRTQMSLTKDGEDDVNECAKISDEEERLLVEMANRFKGFCNTFIDCSSCEFYLAGCTIYYEYCPECGAKMDGGE